MSRCFNCHAEALRPCTVEHRIRIGSTVFRVALDALECSACAESTVDGPVLAHAELEVASRLAREGLATGEGFRFMRKALGFNAADLAAMLGVRAETISRWETGKTAVDRGAFAALAAMVTDRLAERTTTRDVLLGLTRPPRPRRRIVLDLSHRPDRPRT